MNMKASEFFSSQSYCFCLSETVPFDVFHLVGLVKSRACFRDINSI